MQAQVAPPTVKLVGTNGQISIGKQYAGRQVLVEEQEPGVWMIRTATVIPDNELWLHTGKNLSDVQEALQWAQSHPSKADNARQLIRRLRDAQA